MNRDYSSESLKILGARVITCALSKTKPAVYQDKDADQIINYERKNIREAIKCLTNNLGVDVVFKPIESRFAEHSIRSIA